MTIRKKSPDTLKQQKNSFLNYIKHKEKYSEAIADLFLDDELEKIDDVESVKQHLEEKGISKELIDSLEADYQSYLRGQSFYGPEINFTEDTAESLKSNNKILKKLKNDIVKEYNLIKDFLALDIKKYVDEKFSSFNKKDFKNIGREISILDRDIYNLKREINSLNEYNSDEEQNIYLMNIKLNGLNIFQVSKKNKLKKSIEDSKQKVEENKLKIEELSEILNKKVKEYCKLKKLDNEINLNLTSFDRIKVLFGGKKRIDKKLCEISINEILSELSVYGDYIPERSIKTIESFITDSISLNLKEKKNSIIKMIKSYLNYFYFGEDRNRFNGDLNISLWGVLPTIYTDVKIDSKINGIINDLGGKININGERIIDRNFIDDVFIHTTGFNVLDEILNEGGLISTNEAQRRSKDFKYYNIETGINDIENSITQTINPHKDIYFSRGFRKNGYGKHESENSDDYVFIVNTMSNFANHGYGVPLNIDMQNNPGFATGDSSHDSRGYSIISKSALEDKQNGYSKIDMKDFYIFIPETKKREIEDNPKYKTNGANIIYFPENFKGRMSYELYEFIKNEIAIRDRDNDKKTPIPRKIVNSIDNISDISGAYEWAFCEKINDNKEYDFNPLDGSEDQLLTFLKNESTNNIAYSGISIDFNELKDFLSEQSLNIENLKATLNFPKELVTLVITCSKIGLGESGEGRGKRRISDICDKLGTFGYSSKEVGIVYNTIDWICEFKKFLANNDIKLINDLFKNRIKGWCNDWNVDYDKMAEFLKQSIIITRDKRMSDGLLNSVF